MHHRNRHIEKILEKRAKMFPVLGVLGPRQVGKSTFLMSQWSEERKALYLTFDKYEVAARARRAPEQFLLAESEQQTQPLIIDEAQKIPHIFDSIKALVDEKRRLGVFTLSGSVDFSAKAGVRESLAGRMGTTRLYPMTLRELNQQNFLPPWVTFEFKEQHALNPKSIEQWLERGGMPIFCGMSDLDERLSLIHSWLESICYKDLKQLKDAKYDSELAFNLLTAIASEPAMSISKLVSALSASFVAIKKHISALKALFLLYEIPSFTNPKAHSEYRIFDSGVLNALLGGKQTIFPHHASLITLVINEIKAQYEYAGKLDPKLYYYAALGGAEIDLVLKSKEKLVAIQCVTTADITPYQQRGMKSFLKTYPQAKGYFVAPVQKKYKLDKNLEVIPWVLIG